MHGEQEAARVEVHRVFVGTGLFWGLVLATVLTVIVIILAAQNIQQVTVKFLTFEGGAPLIAVLSVFVTATLGYNIARTLTEAAPLVPVLLASFGLMGGLAALVLALLRRP